MRHSLFSVVQAVKLIKLTSLHESVLETTRRIIRIMFACKQVMALLPTRSSLISWISDYDSDPCLHSLAGGEESGKFCKSFADLIRLCCKKLGLMQEPEVLLASLLSHNLLRRRFGIDLVQGLDFMGDSERRQFVTSVAGKVLAYLTKSQANESRFVEDSVLHVEALVSDAFPDKFTICGQMIEVMDLLTNHPDLSTEDTKQTLVNYWNEWLDLLAKSEENSQLVLESHWFPETHPMTSFCLSISMRLLQNNSSDATAWNILFLCLDKTIINRVLSEISCELEVTALHPISAQSVALHHPDLLVDLIYSQNNALFSRILELTAKLKDHDSFEILLRTLRDKEIWLDAAALIQRSNPALDCLEDLFRILHRL
ncbi:hypothetical protein Ciccas_010062 [Cichlidogyrus casuarinus]|uniref:Uncharacterized protein n=1 Tax=Cichlidogyrus casuarinus TaxID=1844966 RepID=A0ABD2PVH7_9PLAT